MAQRVLVTGASGGIGEATVLRLLEAGYEVTATARRQEDVDLLG
jgi:NADP-dependent 3-hydroxy acid dehydrogenase YdfG